MCPSLIEIGSKTAEKNSAQTDKQTDKQTDRHYENNGHLAVNQWIVFIKFDEITVEIMQYESMLLWLLVCPSMEAEYCESVAWLSAMYAHHMCLSVCMLISGTTRPNFT